MAKTPNPKEAAETGPSASNEPTKPKARRKPAKPKKDAVGPPVLFGRSSVLRALIAKGPAALTGTVLSDAEARAEVVINLSDKIDGLIDVENKLTAAVKDPKVSAPDQTSAKLRKKETIAERELCRTRLSAINHSAPFHDPGQAEEDKLMKALDAVTKATATAAGIVNLLQAADNLVKTYKAKSTE